MKEEKVITSSPSIDKPWLKYYSEEAIKATMPECTIYEYIRHKNLAKDKRIALEYFGDKIT